jgi:hypothetical protein
MSGNPSVPPSNVVPMPTNWPGPMFMPKTWPPGGPSCFSELASLNACYDSVQMMEQILAKVITDLVTNNTAVQAAIVEAIAKSGSNVPLIGVTNGSDAQPGQVGEWLTWTVTVTYPATTANQQVVSIGTLPPGDWDVYSAVGIFNLGGATGFFLNPVPAGFTSSLQGQYIGGGAGAAGTVSSWIVGVPSRALISAPSLIAFQFNSNQFADSAATSTSSELIVFARRRR